MRYPARPRRSLTLVALSSVGAVALLAGACSRSAAPGDASGGDNSLGTVANRPADQNPLEPNDPPKDGGKVVMAVTAETNGFNPALNQWADAGNFVGSAVLEPLLTFDPQGSIQPFLADSVTPKTAGDFSTWMVKVKPNIRLHNGEILDAALVKKNIDQTRAEGSLSAIALKGMFNDVKVIDSSTVEVDLAQQWAEYPSNLAGPSGYIMAAAQIDSPNGGPDHPIGTGPFAFDSWQRDSSFRAKKFSGYWQKGQPHLDEVEFKPITDAKSRVQALRAGNVDMILTTHAEDVDSLKDSFSVVRDYNGEKTFVMLNTAGDSSKGTNPFKSVHARRALAYATDRSAVVSAIGGNQQLKSSTTPFLAGTQWEIDDSQTGYYPFDLQKAKDEVDAYKKETGESEINFHFAGLANLEDTQIQQILQEQWKKVGISSTIDTREQTSYVTQAVIGAYQAAYFRNYGYIDPDSDWVFFHSSQAKGLGVLSINFQQLKDAQLDAAMDDARSTTDVARRKADYVKATQRINDNAVNIWLFNTPYAVISDPHIRGLNDLRTHGFGNFLPHPWLWNQIWKQ